jgi:O-antigen ligase
MVVAIVLSVVSGRYGRQFFILAMAATLLLALGSRSHFFSLLCVILATIGFAMIRGRSKIGPIVFLIVAVMTVYFSWEILLETRAAEILDLGSSASWQERQGVQALAIDVIRANPLVGDFAYHLREIGPGGYAHNALSAWTQFGLIGFLLYGALIVYFTLLSFARSLSSRSQHGLWQIAFALNLSALVMAIASEQVFSEVPALAWGSAVNALLADARVEVGA